MKPRNLLLEKVVMHQDFVAAESMARTARSRAVGTAIADAAKGLLAFTFRFIQPGPADNRPGRNAAGQGDGTLSAGRWIAPKAPLVLRTSQSRTVFCDVGTVWITQGDSNDFVLNAGEKLTLHPVGKVIVTAMTGPALIRHGQQQSPQSLLTEKEHEMNELTLRERELVALGAALGSNCQPCAEFHIPAARSAGLSDTQISEAIGIADKVRKVPALKVLHAALAMLPKEAGALPVNDDAAPRNGASTIGGAKFGCCA